jgi:hypothetical protein
VSKRISRAEEDLVLQQAHFTLQIVSKAMDACKSSGNEHKLNRQSNEVKLIILSGSVDEFRRACSGQPEPASLGDKYPWNYIAAAKLARVLIPALRLTNFGDSLTMEESWENLFETIINLKLGKIDHSLEKLLHTGLAQVIASEEDVITAMQQAQEEYGDPH